MDAASDADRPRIRPTTRRAFIGVNRAYRRVARLRGSSSTSFLAFIVRLLTAPRPAVVLHVTLEGPRRRELAELVADHRFGDEHRDVLAAVVHRDRVPEHVGDDRGPARPGLDHGLGVLVVRRIHLLEQVVVDERALLETAGHPVPTFLLRTRWTVGSLAWLLTSCSPLLALTPATHDELVAFLVRPAGAALRLPVRVHRVTPTGGLALATAVRVVDRVHGHATHVRTLALPTHAAGLAPVDVGLLGVADLADRGAAAYVDVADLAGRHPELGERALLGDQLDAGA